MRPSKVHVTEIVHKRELPSHLIASKVASKRFRDGMNTLVRKVSEFSLSSEDTLTLFIFRLKNSLRKVVVGFSLVHNMLPPVEARSIMPLQDSAGTVELRPMPLPPSSSS